MVGGGKSSGEIVVGAEQVFDTNVGATSVGTEGCSKVGVLRLRRSMITYRRFREVSILGDAGALGLLGEFFRPGIIHAGARGRYMIRLGELSTLVPVPVDDIHAGARGRGTIGADGGVLGRAGHLGGVVGQLFVDVMGATHVSPYEGVYGRKKPEKNMHKRCSAVSPEPF